MYFVGRFFTLFFMLRPTILLAFGVAILDEHTRLTSLETKTSLLAAIGTAVGRRIDKMMVHDRVRITPSYSCYYI
jgi:hypothetical protein